MSKVFTKFNAPKSIGEVNVLPKLVETAGYMSAQKRIEALIYSGEQLALARKNEYDFESEDQIPEGYNDPTKEEGFDELDGYTTLLGISPIGSPASGDLLKNGESEEGAKIPGETSGQDSGSEKGTE